MSTQGRAMTVQILAVAVNGAAGVDYSQLMQIASVNANGVSLFWNVSSPTAINNIQLSLTTNMGCCSCESMQMNQVIVRLTATFRWQYASVASNVARRVSSLIRAIFTSTVPFIYKWKWLRSACLKPILQSNGLNCSVALATSQFFDAIMLTIRNHTVQKSGRMALRAVQILTCENNIQERHLSCSKFLLFCRITGAGYRQ